MSYSLIRYPLPTLALYVQHVSHRYPDIVKSVLETLQKPAFPVTVSFTQGPVRCSARGYFRRPPLSKPVPRLKLLPGASGR
jgi:hypothetical protein